MKTAFESPSLFSLEVPGDLLSTSVESLRSRVVEVLACESLTVPVSQDLTVDLRATRLMDSAGVNFLVGILRACRKRNLRMKVVIASRLIERTLLFTRLDKYMEIVLEE